MGFHPLETIIINLYREGILENCLFTIEGLLYTDKVLQ